MLLIQHSPQLLQVLADSPVKLLNVFLLHQILKSGAASLPIDSCPPFPILAQSSMGLSMGNTQPKSTILFQKGNPITVNGKPKFIYSGKGSIKLLAHLNIVEGIQDGKIAKTIIDLTVKDPGTMKSLLGKSYRLKDITSNSIQELELLPSDIQNLPRNKDLLVSITSRYIDARNKLYTCEADVHLIFIVNGYFYKGVGNKIVGSIPLEDRTRYRVFWNKIWEGGTKTKKRWKVNLTAKYYIYYRFDQSSNGRIETRIQQIKPDSESEHELNIEGKMKSGLEITPDELNNLLPSISSNKSLDEIRLEAFRTDELSKDINSEALAYLKIKGRTNKTGVIWTYPEVCLFEFYLNKIITEDQNGQVTETNEEIVVFPKLVSIHFLGERTTGSDNIASIKEEDTNIEDGLNNENGPNPEEAEATKSEGYERIFNINVELRPVELAPIKVSINK
jgi:hypothetical protein